MSNLDKAAALCKEAARLFRIHPDELSLQELENRERNFTRTLDELLSRCGPEQPDDEALEDEATIELFNVDWPVGSLVKTPVGLAKFVAFRNGVEVWVSRGEGYVDMFFHPRECTLAGVPAKPPLGLRPEAAFDAEVTAGPRGRVNLDVTQGQLDGDTMMIRFDDEPGQPYKVISGGSDSTFVQFFFMGDEKAEFLAKLAAAKRVRVQASFFSEGSYRIFEFAPGGLTVKD